ncbi:16S rRNA (cytidine(1402)-2'-O)-methyltransferase [Maricaulis sp.]|uniref:16S rRNA (cytidine(1402)-2'-O)-methyltransferase n=1 Tax=Maricaulis sp. TaxID=1486257 RepID=UPI0026209CE8|nr:16S rRNA (cytidine(1402)-2'-O)-methyltransferase [Maricaulis sp.]
MTGSSREFPPEASRTGPKVQALSPGLYLVATPIGNLRDITLRALDVLAAADRVLAEDTRVTKRLLDAHGVSAALQPYHDHNGERVRPAVLEALAAGEVVALVSDAGTPLVSDPGYKLVREVIEAGHEVIAIPGASAALAALCIAGLPTDCFTFAGFPPSKTAAREAWLARFSAVPGSLVFYEGASRLPAALTSMAKVFGDRPAAVCRELTKLHEEARRGGLDALAAHYEDAGAPKGEVVIVIAPAAPDIWDEARIDAALQEALQTQRVKDAAADIASKAGRPKRDIYARALALKDASG